MNDMETPDLLGYFTFQENLRGIIDFLPKSVYNGEAVYLKCKKNIAIMDVSIWRSTQVGDEAPLLRA